MNGTLYIVPTPIGNLEDMTYRAVRILKEVDLILCESTLVSKRLLEKYEIENKTSVFYANTGIKNIENILTLLSEGKKLALISDAGTPTISDPGVLLVDRVRKELQEVSIVALPGASALLTALSASGISSATFTFYGFVPHKKGRETLFATIAESEHTSAFYESVHRIEKTLESLAKVLEEERLVVVARELTKLHEEVIRGNIGQIIAHFKANPDHIRGEFVVVVEGKK